MIDNIPEALHSSYGGYTSSYDDGTNRYAEWVKIEGLPGLWPDGPHRAAIARDAESALNMARDISDDAMSPEKKVALVVTGINDRHRIRNPDVARQAAHYENVLRGFLPEVREELIAAHGAIRAYQNVHGVPERPSYAPGYLPNGQEIMDDRMAAEKQFAEAVGPEVFAEGVRLSADFRSAQDRLEKLCTDLYLRSADVTRDYAEGIDNTEAHQAADRAKYGVARQT